MLLHWLLSKKLSFLKDLVPVSRIQDNETCTQLQDTFESVTLGQAGLTRACLQVMLCWRIWGTGTEQTVPDLSGDLVTAPAKRWGTGQGWDLVKALGKSLRKESRNGLRSDSTRGFDSRNNN